MNKEELENILNYIVKQSLETIEANARKIEATIDYVAIFAKNKSEFNSLDIVARSMGNEIDKETARTGNTYSLHEPIKTSAGLLKLIKIRFPDPTRPQRGAPDFKIQNYQEFKSKYLKKSGNFTLMLKEKYEMIEIKGVNVLVYIPNNTLGERLKTK